MGHKWDSDFIKRFGEQPLAIPQNRARNRVPLEVKSAKEIERVPHAPDTVLEDVVDKGTATYEALPVNSKKILSETSTGSISVAVGADINEEIFSYVVPVGYAGVLRLFDYFTTIVDTSLRVPIFPSAYFVSAGEILTPTISVLLDGIPIDGLTGIRVDASDSIDLYGVINESGLVTVNYHETNANGTAGAITRAFVARMEIDLMPIRGVDYRHTVLEG